MTKPTACFPCAKRKVRCDRQEPCSHCKRRKGDDCTYPEASPEERIKYLEELIRSLGHSPDSKQDDGDNPEASPAPVRSRKRPHPTQPNQDNDTRPGWVGGVPNNGPAIIEEDGETVYLEASTWHSWDKRPRLSREDESANPQTPTSMRSCMPVQPSPGALQSIVQCDNTIDLASKHPSPDQAAVLWTACNRNVIPLVKIAFQWELDQMRSMAVSPNTTKNLLPREHALFFTIYLNAVTSLSDEECLGSLGESRKTLLSRYRNLSENSVAKADFLGQSELILVQAFIYYISASLDELRTRSLWSFIGIALRHAERLGLHRDGSLLRLSPAETEKRRRIWWQLQHLDIALAIRSGSISLNLMADWDVRLPLNIEDEDISPASTEFPPERKGLTSISYCLWTYSIIETQRSFRRPDGGRVGGSWQADRSIPRAQRESFLNELENCVNVNFIQYCDPIVPLQLLILITARTFIWSMRRLLLHSDEVAEDTSDSVEGRGKALLAACTRCLEYDIYLHSQPALKRFYWRAKGFFSWHAFVYVISEASQYCDDCAETWELLGKIYSRDSHLSTFTGDRRKPRAAEMVLSAWQAYEKSYTEVLCARPQRPEFLARLEELLTANKGPVLNTDYQPRRNIQSPVMDVNLLDGEADNTAADNWAMNLAFDVDPTDVDWSFWSNWE